MRLALLEAKIGMAMVLQKLKFVQCEGTKVSDTIMHEMNVIFVLSSKNQMVHSVTPTHRIEVKGIVGYSKTVAEFRKNQEILSL